MKKLFFVLALILVLPSVQAASISLCRIDSNLELGKSFTWTLGVWGGDGVFGLGREQPEVQVFLQQGSVQKSLYYNAKFGLGKGGQGEVSGSGAPDASRFHAGECNILCVTGQSTRTHPCVIVDRAQAAKDTVRESAPVSPRPAAAKPSGASASPGASGSPDVPAAKPPKPPASFSVSGYTLGPVSIRGVTTGNAKHFFGSSTEVRVPFNGPTGAKVFIQVNAHNPHNAQEIIELARHEKTLTGQSQQDYLSFSSLKEGTYDLLAVMTDASGRRLASAFFGGSLESVKTDAARRFQQAKTFKEQYDSLTEFCKDLVVQLKKAGQLAELTSEEEKLIVEECRQNYGSVHSQQLLAQAIQEHSSRLGTKLETLSTDHKFLGFIPETNLITAGKETLGQMFGVDTEYRALVRRTDGLHDLEGCTRKGLKVSAICQEPHACVFALGVDPAEVDKKVSEIREACQEGTVQVIIQDERDGTNGDPSRSENRLKRLYDLGQQAEKQRDWTTAYRYYMTAFNLFPEVDRFSPDFEAMAASRGAETARTLRAVHSRAVYLDRNGFVGDTHNCGRAFAACFGNVFTLSNVAMVGGTIALAFVPGPGWAAVGKQFVHMTVSGYFTYQMTAAALKEYQNGKSITAGKACSLACQTLLIGGAALGLKEGVKGSLTSKGRAQAAFSEGQRLGRVVTAEKPSLTRGTAQRLVDHALSENPTGALATAFREGARASTEAGRFKQAPIDYDAQVRTPDFASDLKAAVADRAGLASELKSEFDSVRSELDANLLEIRRLDSEIRQAKGEAKKGLQERRKLAAQRQQSLYAKLLGVEARLQALQASMRLQFEAKAKTQGGKGLRELALEEVRPVSADVSSALKAASDFKRSFDRNTLQRDVSSPEEAAQRVDQLQGQLRELALQAERLREQAEAKDAEAQALEQKHPDGVSGTERLGELSDRLSAAAVLEGTVQHLTSLAEAARRDAQTVSALAASLRQAAEQTRKDIARFQERFDFWTRLSEPSTAASWKQNLEAAQLELERLTNAAEAAEQQAKQLTEQADVYTIQAAEVSVSAQTARTEANRGLAEATAAEADLARAKALRAEAEAARVELEKARERADALELEIARVEPKTKPGVIRASVDFLMNQWGKLKERLDKYFAERKERKVEQAAARQAEKEGQALYQQVKDILEKINEQNAALKEREALREQLREEQQLYALEQARLERTRQEAEAAKKKLEEAQSEPSAIEEPARATEPNRESTIRADGQIQHVDASFLEAEARYVAARFNFDITAGLDAFLDLHRMLDSSGKLKVPVAKIMIDGRPVLDWYSDINQKAKKEGLTREAAEADYQKEMDRVNHVLELEHDSYLASAQGQPAPPVGAAVSPDTVAAAGAASRLAPDGSALASSADRVTRQARRAQDALALEQTTRLDAPRVLSDPRLVVEGVEPGVLQAVRSTLDTYLRSGETGVEWSVAKAALDPLKNPRIVTDAALRKWFSSKEFNAQARAHYEGLRAERTRQALERQREQTRRAQSQASLTYTLEIAAVHESFEAHRAILDRIREEFRESTRPLTRDYVGSRLNSFDAGFRRFYQEFQGLKRDLSKKASEGDAAAVAALGQLAELDHEVTSLRAESDALARNAQSLPSERLVSNNDPTPADVFSSSDSSAAQLHSATDRLPSGKAKGLMTEFAIRVAGVEKALDQLISRGVSKEVFQRALSDHVKSLRESQEFHLVESLEAGVERDALVRVFEDYLDGFSDRYQERYQSHAASQRGLSSALQTVRMENRAKLETAAEDLRKALVFELGVNTLDGLTVEPVLDLPNPRVSAQPVSVRVVSESGFLDYVSVSVEFLSSIYRADASSGRLVKLRFRNSANAVVGEVDATSGLVGNAVQSIRRSSESYARAIESRIGLGSKITYPSASGVRVGTFERVDVSRSRPPSLMVSYLDGFDFIGFDDVVSFVPPAQVSVR